MCTWRFVVISALAGICIGSAATFVVMADTQLELLAEDVERLRTLRAAASGTGVN